MDRAKTAATGGVDARTIALLALLSRHSNFSVGCYSKDEARCHRVILRALLPEQGAQVG